VEATPAGLNALTAVREALRSSPAPLNINALQQTMKTRHRLTNDDVTSALTELVQNQQAYSWPAFRRVPRYWYCDAEGYIRDRILEIASEVALCKPQLETRAAKKTHRCSKNRVGKSLAGLVSEREVVKAKAAGQVLYFKAGASKALIAGSLDILRQSLMRAGITDQEIRIAGFGPGAETTPLAQAGQLESKIQSTASLAGRILVALREIEPAPGAPVTANALRARVPDAGKAEFDRAVMQLAEQQQVYVTRHDHGWALPESDRQQLIHDGGTNLYVAVATRG
jgi:hypothetical protein